MRGQPEDMVLAEQSFHEALSMANQLGAGGWALKSALSLAQFLNGQGRKAEAKAILEQGLAGFSAQDVGPDLESARSLLQQSGS
jgi:hypothetical protein